MKAVMEHDKHKRSHPNISRSSRSLLKDAMIAPAGMNGSKMLGAKGLICIEMLKHNLQSQKWRLVGHHHLPTKNRCVHERYQ